jgi:hypothetical protein
MFRAFPKARNYVFVNHEKDYESIETALLLFGMFQYGLLRVKIRWKRKMQKKIALCLYGKFNNRLDPKSGIGGFEYIKDTILDKYPVDIFIYSTDIENQSEIMDLYKPWIRDVKFEREHDFSEEIQHHSIDENFFSPIQPFRTLRNTLAFLYSRKQAIDLMASNSLERGSKYDSVIAARFDLGQLDKVNGNHSHKVSEIGFSEDFDMAFIYSAAWEQLNEGLADQWFFSGQRNMEKLGLMYDSALKYFSPNSDYLNFVSNGIIDSNAGELMSNEMLKTPLLRSKRTVKLPPKLAVNNHLLHKYFFIETELYSKLRFSSDFRETATVLYTHSDYKDVWPVYFGQQVKFLGPIPKSYVFLNRFSTEIPDHYTQIIYDDSQSYTDRLLSCIKRVPESTIMFQHEDMFLYKTPKAAYLSNAIRSLETTNPKFDVVKLIRGGLNFSYPSTLRGFSRISFLSPWIFSIQPSIWRKKSLIELLSHSGSLSIWEFEIRAQKLVKKLRIRTLHPSAGGKRRGRHHSDSQIYPFVATAISKGKWNFSEYGIELHDILSDYKVDPNIRGKI